jgi:hypothetical protein
MPLYLADKKYLWKTDFQKIILTVSHIDSGMKNPKTLEPNAAEGRNYEHTGITVTLKIW